jgi:hypothetical protein
MALGELFEFLALGELFKLLALGADPRPTDIGADPRPTGRTRWRVTIKAPTVTKPVIIPNRLTQK